MPPRDPLGFRWSVLFLSAVLAAACGGPQKGKVARGGPCVVDGDCELTLFCLAGTCEVSCASKSDCGAGELCVLVKGNAVCRAAPPSCTATSTCPGQTSCAPDGRCEAPCVLDTDCLDGEHCAASLTCLPTEVGAT
jgi:hypothetical protein